MSNLATFKAQVERNLMDTTNLVWPSVIVEEAIRASLAEISRAYNEQLFINQLDGSVVTTVELLDFYLLVKGAVAFALLFRTVGRFEEASPESTLTPALASVAEQRMKEFRYYLLPIYAEHGTYLGDDERLVWQSAENALDRALQVAEAALDRAATSDLQDDLLFWKEAQAALDRAHKVSEAALDRSLKVSEADLDRTHDFDIMQAKWDREDDLALYERERLEELQESDETPWSDWKWNEGKNFL